MVSVNILFFEIVATESGVVLGPTLLACRAREGERLKQSALHSQEAGAPGSRFAPGGLYNLKRSREASWKWGGAGKQEWGPWVSAPSQVPATMKMQNVGRMRIE